MPHDVAKTTRFTIHPAFAGRLAALGIDSAESVLALSGEIVSGHPDRHVLRVELPGLSTAFYLKRQHIITRRERLRNWRAGFGWVSRSERERALLDQLARSGLPAPRWVAAGEDGRGRAFLLVAEITGACDLRSALLTARSPSERAILARRIGHLVGDFHRLGFTTPDLTAKHLFICGKAVIPIDWQNARRGARVSLSELIRALAALHASVAYDLASVRERLRVLRAALRSARAEGQVVGRLSIVARRIAAEARRLAARRSIRDQRHVGSIPQRLVWVAGEAVCAIPEVAAIWPTPAIAAPFYDAPPGRFAIELPDGRSAHLIRGHSIDPIGRLIHQLRGKSWRSSGAVLGRVLFHMERYGIPAPRLLAFGQRLTGRAGAEWFVLHTPPPPGIPEPTRAIAGQLGRRLRQMHDAGLRPYADPRLIFGLDEVVAIRDVKAIRLVKRITRRERLHDLGELAHSLAPEFGESVRGGYLNGGNEIVAEEFVLASECR